jgi:hypothetical protein
LDEEIDYSSYVPEEALEEIREYEEEVKGRRHRKKNYPTSRDIVETVKEIALTVRGIHPHDFPEIVLQALRDKGFDTSYVTVKRIWRTYEKLVREGVIPDTLGVVY